VPFFIYQTAAVCRGRGEIVEPVKLAEGLQGLLIHPGFGVSTPWAYKTYAQNPGRGVAGRAFAGFTLRNDLEPPAFSKYPWLPTAKGWLREQPEVLDALMSGSGSSVFALTVSAEGADTLRKRFVAEFGSTLFVAAFRVTSAGA
jgi:4-diphosphocytidyl-2-C-methyl-D-erythritol kinase